jgi:dihydroorotase
LRGIRDVGIRYGQIAAVEAAIDPALAKRSIDAKGKLVTPGLVDLHTHIYAYGSACVKACRSVVHQLPFAAN